MQLNNEMMQWAINYAEKGWSVFPIKPPRLGGSSPGKTPYLTGGFKNATRDPAMIKQWWTKWPDANIGIATGRMSGGLVVIDLDIHDETGISGYETLRDWERQHGDLPETCQSITGCGGYHLFYKSDKPFQSLVGIHEGVDVRCEGGYIIAPPSLHKNGRRYEWEYPPDEFEIAEADSLVSEFISKPQIQEHTQFFQVPEKIYEGGRVFSLVALIGSLRSKGLGDNAIVAAVEQENNEKCVPPLTRKELHQEVFPALKRDWKSTNPYIKNSLCDENEDLEYVRGLLAYKTEYDKSGNEKSRKLIQNVKNFEIVLDNDERFKNKIKFDEFSQQTYLMGNMPWETSRNNYRAWSSFDDSALFSILQSDYGLNSRNDYYDALKIVAMRNRFHPVRDLLNSLKWDGEEHIRNLLPDYLGVEDTEYTYQVMRLWMLGAVSRVFHPGCKFDYTVIFQGRQGLGKSSFLQLMALNDGWFNDSLDSLDSDKAAQSLMGSWIIELAELKSLARTAGGVDSVKRFLTATQDKYRVPYERRADVFLRQSVFAGTTNKSDFLQDETGNRRFLIIHTGVNEPKKNLFAPEAMNDIKLAWAQAVQIYKTEKPELLLPESCRKKAAELQSESLSDDGKIGIIQEYLSDKHRTCAIEIWQKALGEQGRPAKWQASEISNIILGLPEWERIPSPAKFGEYGSQRGFQKKTTNTLPEKDCSSKSGDCSNDFMKILESELSELPFD